MALPPSAVTVLQQHHDKQRFERQTVGEPVTDETLVFSNFDGTPWLPDRVTKAFKRIARKAGYENVHLHDSRHTHATLMLKAGVHPKVVSERLGHSTVAT